MPNWNEKNSVLEEKPQESRQFLSAIDMALLTMMPIYGKYDAEHLMSIKFLLGDTLDRLQNFWLIARSLNE